MARQLLARAVALLVVAPALCACALLTVDSPLSGADAIVLVAGDHQVRAPAAAALYREGRAPRIILTNDGVFSSWSPKYNRNLYQVEWAAEELVELGVPRERIVLLPFYRSGTIYDALAVRVHAAEAGLARLILVTSDYHTRRTLWTFRNTFRGTAIQLGIHAVPSPVGIGERLLEAVKFGYYWARYGVLGMVPDLEPAAVPGRDQGKEKR